MPADVTSALGSEGPGQGFFRGPDGRLVGVSCPCFPPRAHPLGPFRGGYELSVSFASHRVGPDVVAQFATTVYTSGGVECDLKSWKGGLEKGLLHLVGGVAVRRGKLEDGSVLGRGGGAQLDRKWARVFLDFARSGIGDLIEDLRDVRHGLGIHDPRGPVGPSSDEQRHAR